VESKNKKLRSGYTTGACAAAAAKAAAMLVLRHADCKIPPEVIRSVEIPFPNGSRATFKVHDSGYEAEGKTAFASVIKDAGDDPDITNGAEIVATAQYFESGVQRAEYQEITIRGGRGVGTVTKPGLAIAAGEAAINPVPRKMIAAAVQEAVRESGMKSSGLEVTISVPAGEELAKKTLNHRLGIVGGISILGTTGIVRPLSEAAWTATITASFDVAKALGLTEVVISTGRTSEKAHQQKYGLAVEAYAMMGDFTEFSLRDAAKHDFSKVHLCAQWAKMIKIAMATPQTHVRHGALEAVAARDFLVKLEIDIPERYLYNTSREILEFIRSELPDSKSALTKVCKAAKRYAEGVTSGVPVVVHLVSYEGDIFAASE
jgi:cobalt-precorrin-5B (C1)-methyltransferase